MNPDKETLDFLKGLVYSRVTMTEINNKRARQKYEENPTGYNLSWCETYSKTYDKLIKVKDFVDSLEVTE